MANGDGRVRGGGVEGAYAGGIAAGGGVGRDPGERRGAGGPGPVAVRLDAMLREGAMTATLETIDQELEEG